MNRSQPSLADSLESLVATEKNGSASRAHEAPDPGSSNVKSNSNGNSNSNGTGLDRASSIHGEVKDICRLPAKNDSERIDQLLDVIQGLKASEGTLVEDRDLSDRECRSLRRSNGQLRRMLSQMHEDDPQAKQIREVLEYWKVELRKSGRTKLPIDGKRADAVRRAVKWGYSFDELKRAIDGAARFPFVVDMKRAAAGPASCRYDELETLFRGEKQIDKLISLAVAPEVEEHRRTPTRQSQPVSIDEVLARLEHVKPGGLNEWTARCPSHDDRHASLSVGLGSKGIVLHCHVGCEIGDMAHALGVEVTQLFDAEPEARPVAPAKPAESLPSPIELATFHARLLGNAKLLDRIRELRGWTLPTLERLYVGFDGQRLIFPVHDERGELVNVLRYLPGERPGDARKLLAARGRSRDLFPAPEGFDSNEVWLVEGEPDALTGHELGLTTIAVPGSNGWRTTWAPRFRGRVVIVCFDCDQPGREAAHRVATSLIEEAREVRSVDLNGERTDGFDLSDFLLAGGSVGELLRMAAASSAIHSLRAAS